MLPVSVCCSFWARSLHSSCVAGAGCCTSDLHILVWGKQTTRTNAMAFIWDSKLHSHSSDGPPTLRVTRTPFHRLFMEPKPGTPDHRQMPMLLAYHQHA